MSENYTAMLQDRALKWFEVHAAQRLTLFNFYIIILALCTTLLGANFIDNNTYGLLFVGIALLSITVTFKFLDVRISFLIKNAEACLIELEKAQSSQPGVKGMIERSDASNRMLTFRQCFNILFLLGGVLSVSIILKSICANA